MKIRKREEDPAFTMERVRKCSSFSPLGYQKPLLVEIGPFVEVQPNQLFIGSFTQSLNCPLLALGTSTAHALLG